MRFEEISLAECAAKIVDNRGKTCPVGNAGRPLIATNCLREGTLYPTYETTRFVSDETYKTWFRGHPAPGDIIFVTKGSPGRVCLAPSPVDFCIAQDMVAIRVRIAPQFRQSLRFKFVGESSPKSAVIPVQIRQCRAQASQSSHRISHSSNLVTGSGNFGSGSARCSNDPVMAASTL